MQGVHSHITSSAPQRCRRSSVAGWIPKFVDVTDAYGSSYDKQEGRRSSINDFVSACCLRHMG